MTPWYVCTSNLGDHDKTTKHLEYNSKEHLCDFRISKIFKQEIKAPLQREKKGDALDDIKIIKLCSSKRYHWDSEQKPTEDTIHVYNKDLISRDNNF